MPTYRGEIKLLCAPLSQWFVLDLCSSFPSLHGTSYQKADRLKLQRVFSGSAVLPVLKKSSWNSIRYADSYNFKWLKRVQRAKLVTSTYHFTVYQITESIENNRSESVLETLKVLASPGVRKAMLLSFILFFFQVMTGINAIMFYTVDVFIAAGSSMDEYEASMVVGAVQVVSMNRR